jgi:hypothetical protein
MLLMPDVFNEMLHEWHNFYFMAGGAAAGLIGLMFVALSLGVGLVTDATREDIKIFATPSIFYFVSVLLLACLMLIPNHTPPSLAIILFLGAIVGLPWTLAHVRQLVQKAKKFQDFTVVDWLSQVILPVASYVLIMIAAICFVADQGSLSMGALWLTMIFLMLSAIANTWSLVMWIIEQRHS